MVCQLLDLLSRYRYPTRETESEEGEEKQIERMVQQANKRIKLAEVHENIMIPIPLLDKRSPFDPENIPGLILELQDDGMSRVGTVAGILDCKSEANFNHRFHTSQQQRNFLRNE